MVGDFLPFVWRKLGGGYPQGVKIKKEGEGLNDTANVAPCHSCQWNEIVCRVCLPMDWCPLPCQWIKMVCGWFVWFVCHSCVTDTNGHNAIILSICQRCECLPFMPTLRKWVITPTVCNGIGPRLQCLNDCQRIDGGLCLNGFISIHVEILPNALSNFADTNEGMNCQRCEILCHWCVKYLLSVCRCMSAIGLNVKEGLNVGLSVIGLSAIASTLAMSEWLPTIELLTCDCTASIYV